MRLPDNESSVLKGCKQTLELFKFPCWRNNTGVAAYPQPAGGFRYVSYGVKGLSDLTAVVPRSGRFMALETKRPRGGRKSEAQKAFLAQVVQAGGIGGFVSDPNTVIRICQKLTADPWADVQEEFDEPL